MGLNMVLRLMGFTKEDICIHGLRGTASTLLNEQRRWDSELVEIQLSHLDNNTSRRAYNHACYLEERRNMMQTWADYLDTLRSQGISGQEEI